MSNMFSVTSTRKENDPPRHLPWRSIFTLLCFVAAIAFVTVKAPVFVQQFHADQRDDYLSIAGPVSEQAEQLLLDGNSFDAASLHDVYQPLFADNESLAAVRIWDQTGQLACEVTRIDPTQYAVGNQGALGDLGAQAAQTAMQNRVASAGWIDPMVHLQGIADNQADITDLLQHAVDSGQDKPASVSSCYVMQDDGQQLASSLAGNFPLLDDAIDSMNVVRDDLAHGDHQSLGDALQASQDAQSSITLALADYRASVTDMPALPSALAHVMPTHHAWQRLTPVVNGRRVLTPLFAPSTTGEAMLTPAGYAEVIYYASPCELALTLAGKCAPAGILLLIGLGLLLTRKRVAKKDKSA